ncbi:MAG TPA: SPOR domain-containing protein, partial [Methylomirabilota bacterium]|nr:SPOR domain-containing protein [Methylomirabilota bacterium]
SIFSALWFRAILVVIVLGVVAAVAVPYVLELANQPAPKTALSKPEMPPMSTAVAPSAPPVASAPAPSAPAPEKSATPEKPAAGEKSAASEGTASAPTPMTPATDTPAAPAAKAAESSKPVVASKSAAPKEPAAARAPRAAAPPSSSGDYFVQVGAFKNPDTAKKLAVRLRGQKYNVEETSASGAQPARSASTSAPPTSAPASASDRYDVHVSGAAPADINAKISAKGLSTEPSGAGVIVRPSMPLRDAVALSKDLAVDGLKVQVRRAPGGSAPAPAAASSAPEAPSDGTLYRVRIGPFDDKSTATSTLRELEQKGYSPFIARGGQ